jgi:hypothetical protein
MNQPECVDAARGSGSPAEERSAPPGWSSGRPRGGPGAWRSRRGAASSVIR